MGSSHQKNKWTKSKWSNAELLAIAMHVIDTSILVRDSSAVRRLFFRLAGAVGRQRALHTENSGFASPTLGQHISTFRGYLILISIRNPYINRFTNHFLFIHNHLTLRKWCYTPLQHDFALYHHFAMLTFIFEPTNVISRY